MSKDEEPIKFVKFVYKKSEEYKEYYANGVMGAISPRGDFGFSFFFEHIDMPTDQKMKIEEDGKLVEIAELDEEEKNKEINIIRDVKVGIIMKPDQAEILGNWLLKMIRDYRSNIKSDENV